MKAFRKNVAIAIDGGGIRGLIVTRALAMLEELLGKTANDVFRLVVGTSTGSIIAAGISMGYTGNQMTQLYIKMGKSIFPNTLRRKLFPLTRYRYPAEPLVNALNLAFGQRKMEDFWNSTNRTDLVITTYDLLQNRTRFIKPWKDEYRNWSVSKSVQASCTVPTYFPLVEDRFVDGGVGSYGNPCYIAAYEAKECLNWDPADTTLISIGTGRSPYKYDSGKAKKLMAWNWIGPVMGVFTQSAYDQQVHLVNTYFQKMDFRRFQIDLREPIEMDEINQNDRLIAYGTRLGRMIISDQYDPAQGIVIKHPVYF